MRSCIHISTKTLTLAIISIVTAAIVENFVVVVAQLALAQTTRDANMTDSNQKYYRNKCNKCYKNKWY
jgi:hypothetical protein